MKNCKKLLIGLLTALMVAVSAIGFAACGGGGNNEDASSDIGGGASVHTHDWNERVTKEATCEEEGVVTYSCYCGESYTVDLQALGHKLKWNEAKAATCTEFGWEAYELCQRDGCGYTTYKQIGAKGHNFDKGYCTVEGCGVAQPPEDHIEHEWGEGVVTTEPTCTVKGVKTFTCWCTEKYTEPVAELGHDKEQYEGQAATCVAIGWNAYEMCKRDGCDYTTYEEIAIDENNHDLEQHVGREATCVAIGWTAYVTCKRDGCDYTTYEEIAIDESNHDYVDGVCSYCDKEYISEGLTYSYPRDNLGNNISYDYYYVSGIGTCTDTNIVISSTYEGLPVKGFQKSAFKGCSSLTSVVIPNGVTSIGDSAFYGCSNLTKISIPNSVTSISDSAFYECSNLTEITIPDNVMSIGKWAFYNTGYYSNESNWENGVLYIDDWLIVANNDMISGKYTVKNGTSYIANSAFGNCSSLTEIEMLDGLKSVGTFAFLSCSNLAKIELPDSVIDLGLSAFGETGYYNDESNWENGVLYIGKHLIEAKKDVVSGDYVIKDGTLTLAPCAFSYCDLLTSVKIPDSVIDISNAFYYCGVDYIEIGAGVTNIGVGAFEYCRGLTEIVVPDNVTNIGDKAFYGCWNLREIVIGANVINIGRDVFVGCDDLTSAIFKNTKGWVGEHWYDGKEAISSEDLADSTKAAYNLMHYNEGWTRTE